MTLDQYIIGLFCWVFCWYFIKWNWNAYRRNKRIGSACKKINDEWKMR